MRPSKRLVAHAFCACALDLYMSQPLHASNLSASMQSAAAPITLPRVNHHSEGRHTATHNVKPCTHGSRPLHGRTTPRNCCNLLRRGAVAACGVAHAGKLEGAHSSRSRPLHGRTTRRNCCNQLRRHAAAACCATFAGKLEGARLSRKRARHFCLGLLSACCASCTFRTSASMSVVPTA